MKEILLFLFIIYNYNWSQFQWGYTANGNSDSVNKFNISFKSVFTFTGTSYKTDREKNMAYPNTCTREAINITQVRLGTYGTRGVYYIALGK